MKEIKYLALEGGGGKGAAYLGSILALEEFGLLPIRIGSEKSKNKIQGIAGASAGSITAFLLAIGFTTDELWAITKSGEFSKFVFDAQNLYPSYANQARMYSNSSALGSKNIYDSTWWKSHDIYDFDDELKKIYYQKIKPFLPPLMSLDSFFESDPNFIELKLSEIASSKFNSLDNEKDAETKESLGPIKNRLLQRNGKDIDDYLHNLLIDKGLISGLEIRKVLSKLMNDKLKGFDLSSFKKNADSNDINSYNQLNNPGGNGYNNPEFSQYNINGIQNELSNKSGYSRINDLTFKRLYEINGVDLVITGTNLSKQIPVYFSRHHTPDFPVIEAVGLSMSIPLFFKPTYLEYEVDFEEEMNGVKKRHNDNFQYKGWFCDAGVINNFPLHSFNGYSDEKTSFDIAPITPAKSRMLELNPNVLGILLDSEKPNFIKELEDLLGWSDTKSEISNTLGLIGALLESLMYWSTDGAIPSNKLNQILRIKAGTLGTYNFKPKNVNVALTAPESYSKIIKILFDTYPNFARNNNAGINTYNELIKELDGNPFYSHGLQNNSFDEWVSKPNK